MIQRASILGLLLFVFVGRTGAQEHLLTPGTSLKITCAGVPAFCVVRTIDATGIVSLPLFGNLPAVNMDRARFQSRLESLLTERFGKRIQVLVQPYSFAGDEVRVEGDVKARFSRKWTPGLILGALLQDVALREDADMSHIVITPSNGKPFGIDLRAEDSALRPGDRIDIGALAGSDVVVVLGPVMKPGTIPNTVGLTLSGAIERVGGLTGHADSSHITVRHGDGREEILDLKRDGSTRLHKGDSIGVGVSKVELFFSVSGRVPHPGLLEYRPGMRLTEAIRASGADPAKVGDVVSIKRILDKFMRVTKFHLTRILAHIDVDPEVQPSDLILLGGR